MPPLIDGPAAIEAAGNPAKIIRECVGVVNTGTRAVSVAPMQSPAGWEEPGQRPEFGEVTVVLAGVLVVEHEDGVLEVRPGQAVHTVPGEWVRYRSPPRRLTGD